MNKSRKLTMKYRLGLDIGTNSIGWAVLELNDEGNPQNIQASGVRIFSDGRTPKSKATLKATRREVRSARRRRDRYLQRRTFLLDELTKLGLFPENEDERLELQKLNPLELRATALKCQLPLHHIGRALFHLNQRRGFKSNRSDRSEEVSTGKVSQSARNLLEQMKLIGRKLDKESYKNLSRDDKKTVRKKEAQDRLSAFEDLKKKSNLSYGSFLWERQTQGLPTRARPNSDTDLFDLYPTRELLEDEFHKIWKAQAEFYPEELQNETRDRIFNVIFTQRELKPQPIGKCSYYPQENRTHRAMPSFQRFRILQQVNHLSWGSDDGLVRLTDFPQDRDLVIEFLERTSNKNAKVSFNFIRKELKKRTTMIGDCEFNFESESRENMEGNLTSNIMQHEDYVGFKWHDWSLEKQDEFVSVILDERLSDSDVVKLLIDEYELDRYSAENCMNANLVKGTAQISLHTARQLAHVMKNELLIQSKAVEYLAQRDSNFVNPYTSRKNGELLPQLPYYGTAVQGHIIPGNADEEDEQSRIGMVSNPTVHIAMNQLRLVVNELIRRFGHPESIAIELARDLPVGEIGRKKIEKEQLRNRQQNEELDQTLVEFSQIRNRENRLRVKLWNQQDKICVFSGKHIGVAQLFSDEIEVEHLIPFSQSLDNSESNKVVCFRQANKDKGNRTPFQAFANHKNYDWNEICDRVKLLPKSKQWRFEQNAIENWNKNSEGEFTPRHLSDTRYISRLAKEYLENICIFNKIDVVTGRLTALLRRHWGLESILCEQRNLDGQALAKNRDDHRHHAIDAIVVGMTTRSLLQKLSSAAKSVEKLRNSSNRLFAEINGSSIAPWSDFRRDVIQAIQEIVVSHKVKHRGKKVKRKNSQQTRSHGTDGQLHNASAYSIVSSPDAKGVSEVAIRRPVESLSKGKLNSIRDPHLRRKFLAAYDKDPKSGVLEFAAKKGIRSVRCTERLTVIPIQNKNGEIYKAFKGDSNWGIEIYRFPAGHKKAGNWTGVVISRFDSNKSTFVPGYSFRPHPAAKLVMRLQINDCIQIEDNGRQRIMRLQKVSTSDMTFAEHHEANVDSRHKCKDDRFVYWRRTAGGLKKFSATKAHVSPTGTVQIVRR